MWSEWRPSWLPSPSSAEVFAGFHSLSSWMTDSNPVGVVSAETSEMTVPPPPEWVEGRTKDASDLFASWVHMQNVREQVAISLLDTLTFGAGVIKSGWDDVADSGKGLPTLSRIDPYAIFPDPSGCGEDDIRYICEARDATLFEIRSRFPERGYLVRPEARSTETRPKLRGLDIVSQSNLGATGVTGDWPGTASPGMPARFGPPSGSAQEDYTDSAYLIETWVKSSARIEIPVITGGERVGVIETDMPHWKFIAVAGNVVLTPEISNPFDHGWHPYSRIPLIECGEWWSLSMSEQILPAVTALNRLLAAMQINGELVGNPIFLEDEQAGIATTKIINRPGARLAKRRGTEVGWLNPPTVSPMMRDLIMFWRDQIDRILGISAVARGENLRRREPAMAVDAVQEASFVRLRSVVANLEKALERSGEQVLSNMVQFITAPRNIALVGPQGGQKMLQLEPRHFQHPKLSEGEIAGWSPLKFRLKIEAGSTLPTSRLARASEYDQLFGMGLVGGKDVLEAHGVPKSTEALERGQNEALQRTFTQLQNKGG